jgi:hypothetical protein
MAMSSVTVVGNSILLGRYKPKFEVIKERRRDKDVYSSKEVERTHTISQTPYKKQR